MEIRDRSPQPSQKAPLPGAGGRPPLPRPTPDAGLPTDSVRWTATQPPPRPAAPAGPAPGTAKTPVPPKSTGPDPHAPVFAEDPAVRVPTQERPLMLGPIPDAAVLPADPGKRTRALLNGMITSAPSVESRRTVISQLEAFGLDAVSLVHNFGTRIVVLPDDMKIEDAYKKYHLDEDAAKDLKSDTGGMYSPSSNLVFLREDKISGGFSARLSAMIARHELAHALDDALGKSLDVVPLYNEAKEEHRTVTSYARTNEAEYFAESAAAWLTPEGEFDQGTIKNALFAPYLALSGFEAATHVELEERDPKMARMLDDVFTSKVPSARPSLHRRKGEQDETFLWRAHQVAPSDERIRIALLERQKARAAGTPEAEVIEGRIEAEYRSVEGKLIQAWKSQPTERKHGFALLDQYGKRAERLEDGPRRQDLDRRATAAVKALARMDARGLAPQRAFNVSQDYEYLSHQLRGQHLEEASQVARAAADALMRHASGK